MNKLTLALAGAITLGLSGLPATAQTALPPGHPPISSDHSATGRAITGGQNNTGNDSDITIPRGSTGADTYQSDSAAAGNANQPSRAVPQGSGGGGGGTSGN